MSFLVFKAGGFPTFWTDKIPEFFQHFFPGTAANFQVFLIIFKLTCKFFWIKICYLKQVQLNKLDFFLKYPKIRMHSIRMRTARLLPVSPNMHCYRGVYLPRGICTCLGVTCQGMYLPGECICPGGCTCPGGNKTFPYTDLWRDKDRWWLNWQMWMSQYMTVLGEDQVEEES